MEVTPTIDFRAERKPWIAGVLSVLVPGCGHLYLGRPELGVCWYITLMLLFIAGALVARSPLIPQPLTLAWVLIPTAGYIFFIRSAISLARSVRYTYVPMGWKKWCVYFGVFLALMSVSTFISDPLRKYVVQFYRIPSVAMVPTLLIGDHIVVDKLGYRLGMVPQRGDVIVFPFPEDETKDFVKRIVGVPGDKLEIRDKQVLLNGIPMDDR